MQHVHRVLGLPPGAWRLVVALSWVLMSQGIVEELADAAPVAFAQRTAVETPDEPPDATPRAPQRRPNLVVILADDMGYSDLGCFGGEIRTPRLDGLAVQGVRFTQFYNTARCCPTRASLLTGLYPHQAGVGHMMEDRGLAGYRGDLNNQCATLAELLHPAGYRSYAVGKWHVTPGATAQTLAHRHNWPLARGFDRYYGTIHGAGSYWDPSALVRDQQLVTIANDPEYQPPTYYYTDAIADHAVRFVAEHQRDHADQPFFLYVAFTAAHWPMHAPAADIERQRGRYDGGYEPIRRARWLRQQQLGIIDPQWNLTPQAGDWSQVADIPFEVRCMEVYAAMVERMDAGIGRLVDLLEQSGQADNTVIMYLQDNGACAEQNGRGVPQTPGAEFTAQPLTKDEQQYGSTPRQTRDGRPVRQGYGVMPGPDDTYIAYGRGWANVSNTPFREYKHWVHEGGISTPLIVHWPAGIAARLRGGFVAEPGHLIDVAATCLELASATYPQTRDSQPLTPLAGVSLVPLLQERPFQRPQPLFWEHEGNRAVRQGRWKAVAKGPQGPWELYDLHADRTELRDLAADQPERVAELTRAWQEWAEQSQVLPWPWDR